MVINSRLQMQAEVYLDEEIRGDLGRTIWFLKDNQIYGRAYKRDWHDPENKRHFLESGATWKLANAGWLPRKYEIMHDEKSKDLAERIINTIHKKAEELSITELMHL